MSVIRVAGIDPALAHFGMAKFSLDLGTMEFTLLDLELIDTDRQVNKVVRQNSDDLRRAQELTRGFHAFASDCALAFSEIPSGGQSARAVYGFGIAVGVIAGSPIPVVQVQPSETKLAAVGTKTASKEEMIEWAVATYPDAKWFKDMHKGKVRLLNKNEHLADACAVAHAGIRTDEFRRSAALWRSAA